jgi:hypothetical protein
MLYHMGERNYECTLCGNKFFQMEHLKRHMQSIHNSSVSLPSTSNNESTRLSSRKKHRSISDELSLQNKQELAAGKQHKPADLLIAEHEQQSYKVTSKCVYKCPRCDFSCTQLYQLNKHAQHGNHSACVKPNSSRSNNSENDSSQNSFDLSQDEEDSSAFPADDNENSDSDNSEVNQSNYSCSFCQFKSDKKLELKVKVISYEKNKKSSILLNSL